jgi:hypothetical protein
MAGGRRDLLADRTLRLVAVSLPASLDQLEFVRRLGALRKRLERTLALPKAEHTTLEDRLAEVERRIVSVEVERMLEKFRPADHPDNATIAKLERFEAFVSQMESPPSPRGDGIA